MYNIRNFPKIELHCHLDGSVRPSTIIELAKKENLELPTENLKDFEKYVQVSSECKSLKDYLEKFDWPIKIMQKKENLKRVAFELIEDVSKQNVKYIEIRFAPVFHLEQGLSYDDVIESVLAGLALGLEKFDVHSNLILSCMRHLSVDKSIEVVEAGKKYIGKGVVAVDLAGNEADFPPELHKKAFDLAKSYGYHITIHAGETGISKNITTAISELHAERIGHGVAAQNDENVLDALKKSTVCVEACPTSNIHTLAVENYFTHPIKSFMNSKICTTVNTDNMTVSNVDLNKEYLHLQNELSFSDSELMELYKNGVEHSFADSALKKQLMTFF
jgi:adenosine deaminase